MNRLSGLLGTDGELEQLGLSGHADLVLPQSPQPLGPSSDTVQPCRPGRPRLTVPERGRRRAAGGHTDCVSVNDPGATGETNGALCVRPLDVHTWPAFARLVEANNGVWGGCWCMGFHVKVGKGRTPAQNRAEKEQRVREGRTHAALGGALAEIARHGGGTVEGYPEETDDRTLSGSFLHTGPMAAFENHGFSRTRLVSPHRWVVTRTVDP